MVVQRRPMLTTMSNRRYLRARKFVPDDALKQFKETEDWRKSTHIDELYDNIDLQEYEDARKLVRYLLPLNE